MASTDSRAASPIIDPEGSGRISRVTVFADHAYVTRALELDCQPGVQRFLIGLRANSVDPMSVQAAVRGSGQILGVQYQEVPERLEQSEPVRELEAQLDEAKARKAALDRAATNLELEARFLDSLVALGHAELPREVVTRFPDVANLRDLLGFVRSEAAGIAERRSERDLRARDLEREQSLLEQRLAQAKKPGGKRRRCIELVFESPAAQTLRVEVSYVAQNASWQPIYKADAPVDLSSLELRMFARIEQTTGEDWRGVRLTVSNAVPLQGAELPDLSTWHVRMARAIPAALAVGAAAPMRRRSVGERVAEPETEFGGAAEEDPDELEELEEADLAVAEERELSHSFEFDLPESLDVDSGGGDSLAPLAAWKLDAEYFFYSVPARDPRAYLVCRARPDRALLQGRLNVHLGGRFVGSTVLTEKRPGEDLLVNLGIDRAVRVERRRVTDKKTETFFGKVDRQSVAREIAYVIGVENQKDRPIAIEVLDSIPVSSTDRIQVTGVEMKPSPAREDDRKRRGVMRWRLELPPAETRELSVRFQVKYPKGSRPDGL